MKTKQLWKYFAPIIYFLVVPVVVSCHVYSCEKISLWCGNKLSPVWTFFISGMEMFRSCRGEIFWIKCLAPRPSGICILVASQALAKRGPAWTKAIQTDVEIFCLWCGHFSSLVWTFFVFIPILQQERKMSTQQKKNFHTRDNKFSTPEASHFHTMDKIFPQHNRQVKKIF